MYRIVTVLISPYVYAGLSYIIMYIVAHEYIQSYYRYSWRLSLISPTNNGTGSYTEMQGILGLTWVGALKLL